jgi:hypothetical protein
MPVTVAAGNGVAFLIGATVIADLVAKACSSPQTAELNADSRAPTLMKWVKVGLIEGAAFVAIAAAIDKQHAVAILAGGAMEGIVTYIQYQHAKSVGLASAEPPTENHAGGNDYGNQVYSQA